MTRSIRSRLIAALTAALVLLSAAPLAPAQPAAEVDLLLILAADVSRSVDQRKYQLQREGYAAAIADRRVLEAITAGRRQRIAVAFVEWSGEFAQRVVIDWSVIDGLPAAQKFADQLLELPRSFADRTAIGAAIGFSAGLFERAPYSAPRHTIDVSGDGTNNAGRDVGAARDDAVARGITINAIAILTDQPMAWNPGHTHPPGGLTHYFQENVIGGSGAFVMAAESFESFGQAIVRKMIAEIAENTASPPDAATGAL